MQPFNACTVQRGIFSLRDCGNASAEVCSQCAQPICPEHSHYGREQILCPKCHAASPDEDAEGTDTGTDDWDAPGWSGRWSSSYHSSHSYVPVGAASAHERFDEFDRNAFATRSDGVPDDDDGDGPAGFSDS